MPHFGLMDAGALGPARAALQRARLHIRAGRQRMRRGRVSDSIVSYYDALLQAMQWHLDSPELRKALDIREGEDLRDERTVYGVLIRSGVLDGSFDFEAFDRLVEKAVNEDLAGPGYEEAVQGLEPVFRQLGVTPFEEDELPPEKPSQ